MIVDKANTYIKENIDKVDAKYKPKFHLSSPIGWINDPNGFSFFNGKFHMFYQFHPYDTVWGPMHWGHSISDDLLHFEHIEVALAPDKNEVDAKACFSGSAIVEDSTHILMYTQLNKGVQAQTIATSTDGIHYKNIQEKVLFDSSILPADLSVPLGDFRDPFIFKRNGIYYCLISALHSKDEVGMVILLQSNNILDWEYKSVILKGTKEQGRMWECPVLLHIDGVDVICVSIQDTPSKGLQYKNVTSTLYYLGKLDVEKGVYEITFSDELDAGFGYYANQVLTHNRKHYLVSWLETATRSCVLDDLKHNWVGVFSLPRELSVTDNRLVQRPISTIDKYLVETIKIDNYSSFKLKLNDIRNDDFELSIENDSEFLRIRYSKNILTLDRSKSGILPTYEHSLDDNSNVRSLYVEDLHQLEIFFDVSIVEIFVNDGESTMTSKVYPINSYNNVKCDNEGIILKKYQYKKPIST